MQLEITKVCADSLRAFTQNNYGITLKSSHAHELVAAYFGYASRAALILDNKRSIDNLTEAEVIILSSSVPLVDQRLKMLKDLPSGLPSSEILSEGVYAPIIADEQFFGRVWPSLREAAVALADERAFDNLRMMGMEPEELDLLTEVVVETMESDVLMTVTFNYPAKAKKPLRHSSVAVTLTRIAGNIGYSKTKVLPTFYYGHFTDPDFELKHGITWS